MKFLLTADWHLRGERPRCRLDDDWLESQRRDIRFVVDEANARQIPLCIVGDIFHLPRVATEVVNMAIAELKRADRVLVLAGNHDLPFHSYDHVEKCSFGTLRHSFEELDENSNIDGGHDTGKYNAAPFGLDKPGSADIRFLHRLVFPDDKSRPMGTDCGQTAQEILEEFPENTWVFTGDYHHSFHYTSTDGRHLVNPGCLNIQAADMIGYAPKVAIIDTDIASVEWVEIPQPASITTDQYLTETAEKDERLGAFLDAVAQGGCVSLSFRDNLENKLNALKFGPEVSAEIGAQVRKITTEILQEVKNER